MISAGMGDRGKNESASVILLLLCACLFLTIATTNAYRNPRVIIVGAGMSGITTGKVLSENGIPDILILEATGRIGGRICQRNFSGLNVEVGANWVEGVNGTHVNPAWEMAEEAQLRRFFSDFGYVANNTYTRSPSGDGFERVNAQEAFDAADELISEAESFAETLPPSGFKDISILAFQRYVKKVPSTPLERAVDYYNFDYEYAEPARVTSLQNTQPLPTFANFGEDSYFVADQRGYEIVVHNLARRYLRYNANGVADNRVKLNTVVTEILHKSNGVLVKTEDGEIYRADYVMVSPSIGVLQSDLIKFTPDLPKWKRLAIAQFDMGVYTKIFLKFPYSFWSTGTETNFFMYAHEKKGYYNAWQHFEVEYPGAHVLLVTVTDDESRRIEQQPDETTKQEAMAVLRDMFGPDIPDATDILVPRWWSDRFYRGSFSNWPIGVNRFEFDSIRAPVGRIYFTGEHTSKHYNGYVHGAYIAGKESTSLLIGCIKKGKCDFKILPKDYSPNPSVEETQQVEHVSRGRKYLNIITKNNMVPR